MKLSVVIAAYNERENVLPLTRRLVDTLRAMPSVSWELVFVVEGTDGTREALETFRGEVPSLRVLWAREPAGLGAAFRKGFAAVSADSDLVVTMDADLNHQPEEIPRLVEASIRTGADVLIGSRFVPGGRIEGTPAWKRLLSGSMNVAMRFLWGLPVRDKTSGYRVYRASALRTLQHRLDDFAFLPELLIQAHRQGLRLAEEPILFRYRVHGVSKMGILKTSRSYLSLLRSRVDRWTLAALLFLASGAAVRLVSTFPVRRWPTEPDALLPGMTAVKILSGDVRVFSSGVRIGALESYAHALVFAVAGPTRAASGVVPLVAGVLSTVVFFALARALIGRSAACVALAVFAIPPPAFLYWTYQPNGYPLAVLLWLTVLLVAERLARGPSRGPLLVLAFGLVSGLAWWTTLQSVAVLLPATLWIALHRPRALLTGRRLSLAALGFALGASPWIGYNVRYPLATFHANFAVRPVGTSEGIVANAAFLVRDSLPELFVSLDPEQGPNPAGPLRRALRLPVAAVWAAGTAYAFVRVARALSARVRGARSPLPGELLLLLVAAVMLAVTALSEAGSYRNPNVRYILPCFFLGAAGVGVLLSSPSRRAGAAFAGAALLAVVAFDLAGVPWPGSPLRQRLARDARDEGRLLALLRERRIDAVYGDYWWVYGLNFVAGGSPAGIPDREDLDYYRYAGALPDRPVRWALLTLRPEEIAAWQVAFGGSGEVLEAGSRYRLFLPAPSTIPPVPAQAQAEWIRTTASAARPPP